MDTIIIGKDGLEVIIVPRRWRKPKYHIHVENQCLARADGADEFVRVAWRAVAVLDAHNKTKHAGVLRNLLLAYEEQGKE